MTSKSESARSPLDTALLILAILVLAASISGFYYVQGQVHQVVRVVGLLVGAAIAVAIALRTEIGRVVWGYVQGSRTELRKVVWPTRRETMQTTLIVIVLALLVGIFLWAVDAVLLWALKQFTGVGG